MELVKGTVLVEGLTNEGKESKVEVELRWDEKERDHIIRIGKEGVEISWSTLQELIEYLGEVLEKY